MTKPRIITNTKKCSICKEVKPGSLFNKRTQAEDLLTVQCKVCISLYSKHYYNKNKEKIAEYKASNKDSIEAYSKIYRYNNKEKIKEYHKTLNTSEGVGVYKAVYPSGVYIGSGQIHKRKIQHLNGDTRIARTLNEEVISFEVLSLTDTKEESLELEQLVIETIGLDNLLNTRNVFLGAL